MVTKNELLALARDIEELRRIRNALVSSAAYHDKEWASQLRKLKDQNTPQSEIDRVNETWELQHKKAILLEDKLKEYNKEQLALVDEALAVRKVVKRKEPMVQRPESDGGPRRHRTEEPEPRRCENIRESIMRERQEMYAARRADEPVIGQLWRGRNCSRD